jgi:Cu-Zn family superoxide dismutase
MQAILNNITKILTAMSLSAIVAGTASATNNGAYFASATLKNANGQDIGIASFTEDATGLLHVNVQAKGMSLGPHGIHIHAVGNCSHGATPFSGAAGHHNPLEREHGLNNPLGAHAGDLPNIEVNASGVGQLNDSTDRATLSPGPTTVFDTDGSALVIHVAQDDQVTNPTGNSGAREACGVIEHYKP